MNYVELYEKHLGTGKRSGSNIAFSCFRCDTKSNTRHLYVDPETGLYCCFRCRYNPDGNGKGSAFKFAKLMGVREQLMPSVPIINERDQIPFDQKSASEVYEYLCVNLKLSEEDKKAITAERGIRKIEQFGVKICYKAGELLKGRFAEYKLIASGLYCRKDGRLLTHATIADGRIIIPYRDDNDRIEYIRSRRSMSNSSQVKYLGPINGQASRRIWGIIPPHIRILVVTEGEFKAMAAIEKGISTVSLPGMGVAHGELVERLKISNVTGVIICFDTQVEHQRDIDHCAAALSRRIIIETGIRTAIAHLPLESDGRKMDIDSYLYRHTPDEFKKILRTAIPVTG
ncbi:MAG: hypothetical protein ACYC0V_01710 [Armatimonadota bacterium]